MSNNVALLENSDIALAERLSKVIGLPAHFQKPENCLIAIGLARKLKTDPYSIMKSSYIVGGKLAWMSEYVSSIINSCGLFSRLKYQYVDKDRNPVESISSEVWGCYAYATEKETKEILKSTLITLDTAKSEGWIKNTKWQSMKEQMLAYRAASFFGRMYLSDYLSGMQAVEEIEDITRTTTNSKVSSEVNLLNEMFIDGELVDTDTINNTIKEVEHV